MRGEIEQKKGMLGAMELTREQLDALYELTVVSDDGHTLGPVGHIYLDDHTQQATWITAKTGLFGLREVFIPFQGARIEPEIIRVRFTKDYILDAPRFDTDGHISEAEQDELFVYFRVRRPGTATHPHATEEQPQALHDPAAAPPPAPPPATPVTEVPDQAAAHPEQVRAESEEVASYGALVDPVADADPLLEQGDVAESGGHAEATRRTPEDAAGHAAGPEAGEEIGSGDPEIQTSEGRA